MPWLSYGTLTLELRRNGERMVGSAPDVDWPVVNADLQPRHFLVTVLGTVVTAMPASSESVVAINGKQVLEGPQRLSDGDIISAGGARFLFSQTAPRVVGAERTSYILAYLIEELEGIAHPLNNRSTSIGRDASNVVVVRNPTASRFHANVRREAGGFTLHSMGSAGTVLNGKLMQQPMLLTEGDTIEIAFTIFEFTLKQPPAGIRIAEAQMRENDEWSRKATLSSERVVDEDGETGEGASPVWAILGLLWFIFFVTLAWLRLRR